MSRSLRLLGHEIVHHTRVFWRTPLSAFFTVAFPLMFLVLFNLLNVGSSVETAGGISFAQFFTPGIAVFAMVTAGYTSIAITTSIDRDEGILKRIQGTPLPRWVVVGGRVGAAVATGLLSVVVMFLVGVALFGVDVVWARLPAALAVLLVGAITFSVLGMAVAGIAPSGQAAPAIANATILPLAFISGIFFPLEAAPGWLRGIASVFPLQPFVEAFSAQWNPSAGPGLHWPEMAVMLAWAVVGAAVAIRTFTWEPRGPGRRQRGRAGTGQAPVRR